MYIYGSSQVHSAQTIRAPHRNTPAATDTGEASFEGVDQLDISSEADFVSQARELPAIRQDRVDQIRAKIARGDYETDEKISLALDRLLEEIG